MTTRSVERAANRAVPPSNEGRSGLFAARPAGLAGGITIRWLLGFFVLLLCTSALLGWLDATRKVDRLIHDTWVRLGQSAPPDDVVIAAIDAESLASLGRWPWSRELQALVLEQLDRHGARAVIVDVLHVEPDDSAAADARLATAVANLPVSILPVLVERGAGGAVTERLPLPALSRAATDLGHIVLPIDDDGLVRRVDLKAGFGRPHWSTLSLAALAALDLAAVNLDAPPGKRVVENPRAYGWTRDREVMVPFVGPSGTFDRVSAARIARGEIERSEIAGRVVFFGLTAAGLGDMVPTPVSVLDQPMPGIEMHANVFTALRNGTLVTSAPAWSGPLAALLVLPLMLMLYSRAPPGRGLAGALIGACLPILASFLLYRYGRMWFAPLAASVPILASYLLWSRQRLAFLNRFLEREQEKMEPHLPRRDPNDDGALAAFFEHASLHLPLAGWRFFSRGQSHAGGQPLPPVDEEAPVGRWATRGRVHSRRYRTPGQLRIDLIIDDPERAGEITTYVDSLSRIRSRMRPPRRIDRIERLQDNAERLSEQMAWLRSVKVFSETVLAGGPIGFVVWNPAGEWVRGNALAREMLPALEERALLSDFLRAVGHDPGTRDGSDDRQRFDALLLDGRPWQLSHEHGERALVVNLSAIGSRLSRRLICASVLDVSEIRSAERARAEMVDYLSHDLRSPLVSALALLGDDTDRRGRDERVGAPRSGQLVAALPAAACSDVAGRIRRSLTMMDDLLNVARADALTEEGFSDVLLEAVLDNALAELLPQARSRGIRLDVDECEEELWMSGDGSSLERAIANIVGNAIKYSEDGSSVRVSLRRVEDEGVIEVTDDGVGIDPAIIGELFTRFRRDARVAGRIKGTGLGLAFVARVVRQHAGSVEATSEPGQGTHVLLKLPLERVAEAEAAE